MTEELLAAVVRMGAGSAAASCCCGCGLGFAATAATAAGRWADAGFAGFAAGLGCSAGGGAGSPPPNQRAKRPNVLSPPWAWTLAVWVVPFDSVAATLVARVARVAFAATEPVLGGVSGSCGGLT